MDQCLFCKIIAGEIPSKKIFEDQKIIAILDIHPAAAGHILLMPKKHITFFEELPKEILEHITAISHRLSGAIIANLKSAGVTSLIQSGEFAGQKSPHFIMHIIPRFENDNLSFSSSGKIIEEKEIEKIMKKLK